MNGHRHASAEPFLDQVFTISNSMVTEREHTCRSRRVGGGPPSQKLRRDPPPVGSVRLRRDVPNMRVRVPIPHTAPKTTASNRVYLRILVTESETSANQARDSRSAFSTGPMPKVSNTERSGAALIVGGKRKRTPLTYQEKDGRDSVALLIRVTHAEPQRAGYAPATGG